ncbi:MAG: deoxyribose-phosphate aldolase [Phycisphaerales bacterium]|nr:deoxyribose-phosphate aldolase [Phycisphaerales bacterium]
MRDRPVEPVTATARAVRFTKRSIKASSKRHALRLALSMIDLTTLEGKDSPEKVRALCQKAITPSELPFPTALPSVAAVCVYPTLVPTALEVLAGSAVKIASVATGFPSGQYPLEVRLDDCRRAVEAGADEIDMVISRGLFLAGKDEQIRNEICQTRAACAAASRSCGRPHAHLKIILETGELGTLDTIRRASDLAIDAASSVPGVDAPVDGEVFIKTSTGKVQPAATMPVTLIMLEAIRDHFRATGVRIGMKPAGGIRTAKSAIAYLVMVKETLGDEWLTPSLFRFGASTLANDVIRQLIRLELPAGSIIPGSVRYASSYDPSE